MQVVVDPAGVHFANAAPGAVVKIFSVEGRVVCRRNVDGTGEFHWDKRAASGRRGAPGVYRYRIEGPDTPRRQGRIGLVH